MEAPNLSRGCRKALAVTAIVTGATAAVLPAPYSNYGIALATGLNAASLYLLKEENPSVTTNPDSQA